MKEIRTAGINELARIEKIELASFPENPWSMSALRATMEREDSLCLLAIADGQAAGYAISVSAADQAEILKVAVLPGHRRIGLGRSLVRALLEHLGESGCLEVFLECRASNQAAVGLYLTLGFKETGRRKGYYTDTNEDAVIMRQGLRG